MPAMPGLTNASFMSLRTQAGTLPAFEARDKSGEHTSQLYGLMVEHTRTTAGWKGTRKTRDGRRSPRDRRYLLGCV